MEISNEATEAAYVVAKRVYEHALTKTIGINDLQQRFSLNPNSASDLINNFACMREGKRYTRTNNAFATGHFLEMIYRDFGVDALNNAISAVSQHLDYYANTGKSKLPGIRKILERYRNIAKQQSGTEFPNDVDSDTTYWEGAVTTALVNRYERDSKARNKCIEHYGSSCVICTINFEQAYGPIGKSFIHVHHLVELSTIGAKYQVDPIADLRPVCPNCHAMIHRKKPAYLIDDVREFLTLHRDQQA